MLGFSLVPIARAVNFGLSTADVRLPALVLVGAGGPDRIDGVAIEWKTQGHLQNMVATTLFPYEIF
jgi:hypothetical protein